MRKVAAGLVCLAFASSAFAGTVTFVSTTGGQVNEGDDAVFEVFVQSSSLASFDTVFMVVGSDEGLPLNFQFAQSFLNLTTLVPADPTSFGVYPSDSAFGGNRFANPAFTAPLLVGTLTVDTTGLGLGAVRDVFVSAERETEMIGSPLSLVASGAVQDPLSGTGQFTIVPEPATMMMLGLGGLAAAYRRRK
jgi:hypothetical protein